MVIDCFTFNGETDILEIRLNCLDSMVDEFIICESPVTFSGMSKPLYFEEQKERFTKWLPKIKYFVIDEYDDELWKMAWESPNTIGAEHWKREFMQKESIKKALVHLQDTDTVFISDVDEIWTERALKWSHAPFKFKLHVYTYFLNNYSTEQFWGTLVSPYKHIRLSCLNHLRSNAWKTIFYAGCHFTSMGGYEELKRKLENSYTEESYWNKPVQELLKENIDKNKDFLGRDFEFNEGELHWPQYLKDNKEKYIHLCKQF